MTYLMWYDVEVYKRYFFIWKHGEESLEKFLSKLNSFDPTIKLTADYSKETINFLAVRLAEVGVRGEREKES